MTLTRMNPIFRLPVMIKRVSPGDYIKLYRTQRENIRSVDIVPPVLGQPGWGEIIVRFKKPVLG